MNSNFAKQLLDEINFVRTKPGEYAAKLLKYQDYFKDKVLSIPGETPITTKEGFGAFAEAAHHLSQMSAVLPLILNSGLRSVAEDGLKAVQFVDNIKEITLNFDKYVENWGFVVGSFNEAIELGSINPEVIIAHLLVDDGDLDRGNRKHLMSPSYRVVGFAYGDHKTYKKATVITYARSFFGHSEDIAISEEHTKENNSKTEDVQIQKKPKITYSMSEDQEHLTKEGKQTSHVDIEKKKIEEDGFLSYTYKKTYTSNFEHEKENLPEGVVKIDKTEKVITEDGKKKKITTIKKRKIDGSVETETHKTDL